MGLGLTGKGYLIYFFKIIHLNKFLISRELLWQHFLPILYEESPVKSELSIGQTRIFKSVRFKLLFNCPTIVDLYFMNKTV